MNLLDLLTFLVKANFLEKAFFGRLLKIGGARRNHFAFCVAENPVLDRCGGISVLSNKIDDKRLY